MNYFLKRVFIFFLIFSFPIIALFGYRIFIYPSYDFSVDPQKHYLFVGASHMSYGVNDSLLIQGKNIALGGERYMYTYLKLKVFLRDNLQVDTVFMEMGGTDTWKHSDVKYFSGADPGFFVPLYYPFFGAEEWKIFLENNPKVLKSITVGMFKNLYTSGSSYMKQMGGYTTTNDIFDSSKELTPIDWNLSYGNEVNLMYLRKIIDLCKEKDVKLYLIYFPMFNPNFFYNQDYYYKCYKDNFSDVELLDYSNWPVPDSLRKDAHHLNNRGAIAFTKELKKRFQLQ